MSKRTSRKSKRRDQQVAAGAREPQNSGPGGSCQEASSTAVSNGPIAGRNGEVGVTNSVLALQDRLGAVGSAEKAADVRARVLARARGVDPSSHRARVRFCKTLRAADGEFIPGETSAALAQVWGLATSTVQRDMSIAYAESVEEADGVDRSIWWHGMYELLEQSRGDSVLVSEAIDNMRDSSGRLLVNEMGLKMISDALGRSRDSVLKVQEQMAKALGLSSSSVEVKVTVGGQKVPSSQAAELAAKAYAFFETELERKMLARLPGEPTLAAEVVSWFLEYVGATNGDVVEVPALPEGGER